MMKIRQCLLSCVTLLTLDIGTANAGLRGDKPAAAADALASLFDAE
jgi:hypothetical protein